MVSGINSKSYKFHLNVMNWQKQAASRSKQKQLIDSAMKTKSILLLLLIASTMIKVLFTFVFVSVVILEIIQDQALVASKHLLIETEDKTPPLARRGHGRDFADDGADYPESDSSGIDYNVNYRHIGEGIDYMAKKKIMG